VAGLALNLLGPPAVARSHVTPARGIGGAKNIALLAYLTLEPGAHTREELAALLWGDSTDAAARASLRQALKRLRTAVGDLLHVDRHAVQVRGSIECDVTQFLHALESSPREAAGFDVPRFLTGLALRHAPVFEEWASVKRRWLLRRFGELLRGLAREAIAQSHWREALGWAERWLACEPLSDEAARLVIESLYLAGDGAAALARFREYRDRLAHEIAAPPSATMLELVRRIERDAERPRRRGAADLSPSAPSFEASLVGRDSQWRSLMGVWDAVTRDAGRVVVIEGEAGVGKTRLAEDFLRWARTAGATVLRGRGYDAQTGIPYGPFLDALRGVLQTPGLAGTAPEWLAEVTRLLPELRQRFPTLPEAAAAVDVDRRWRLFEGIAQLVLSIAAERPTIVFIDDVQWCDTESCALLHFLARRFERSPVAVVATLTLGEFERDAPAARLARALRTHAHASVVALAPLTKDEVWLLIREMGRISAPTGGRRFAERVHAVTDGNPFHVVELIKTLFAQGLLAIAPGTGEWVAPSVPTGVSYGHLQMPRTVHDAIAERVAGLPYELRDLLATVAVAGRGIRTDLVSSVHGMSRLRAAALADALVERRLLAEEGGVYRCAHPMIAEVVRDGLTPARRHELHRAIALSLEIVTPAAGLHEVAGEIARHAERGGERPLAYRYALLASEAAAGRYAFEEALSWLDVASTLAQPGPEADAVNRSTAELLRLAGWAEPPRTPRRKPTPARGIEHGDLDLAAPEPPQPLRR